MFTYNRSAIMRAAHQYWAMQKLHGWLGHRATFADALRRAWLGARAEAQSVLSGRTGSSLGMAATLETCRFLSLNNASR